MVLVEVLVDDDAVSVEEVGTRIGDAVPSHAASLVGGDELVHDPEGPDDRGILVRQQGVGDGVFGSELFEDLDRIVADGEQ